MCFLTFVVTEIFTVQRCLEGKVVHLLLEHHVKGKLWVTSKDFFPPSYPARPLWMCAVISTG